jgi:hypothetical protein
VIFVLFVDKYPPENGPRKNVKRKNWRVDKTSGRGMGTGCFYVIFVLFVDKYPPEDCPRKNAENAKNEPVSGLGSGCFYVTFVLFCG